MKSSARDLEWSKITDEFEGIEDNDDGVFYGIEEIDGYDVDKSEGILRFVKSDKKAKSAEKEPEKKPETRKKDQKKPTKPKAKTKARPADEVDFNLIKDVPQPKTLIQSLNDWPTLSPTIYTALAELGFNNPTEIQKQAIPVASTGKDIIGKASTGSGKTLAFGLPVIDSFIQSGTPEVPQALVVAPTRELAHQIGDHLNKVMQKCEFENTCGCVTVTGGLSYEKQLRLMERNPIIVVGTPGRLFDVMDKMPAARLSNYQKIPTLVFDEADRLVQNNSFEDIDKILSKLGRNTGRQTMVFSATFQPEYWAKLNSNNRKFKDQKDIRETLEKELYLRKNAQFIDADPTDAVASAIVQSIMECPGQEKDLYLYYFTLIYPGKSVVFVNSIDAVKRITPLLKEMGMSAFGVHSDMVQKQRLRAIERFRDIPNSTLIATDVAGRGLDVPAVDHVVHYNLPRTADMYVHRSGRTARAGKQGVSLMLCSPEEASQALPKLCKLVKTKPVPFDVEYDILDRLRERVILAKKIADSVNKATHEGKKKSWEIQAAEDLGIELSDTEQETKSERNLRAYRAQLKQLLEQKIGPNRKYLTSGSINLAKEMLKNPTAIVAGKAASTALESLGKRKNIDKPSTSSTKPDQVKEPAPAPKKPKMEVPKKQKSKDARKAEHKLAKAGLANAAGPASASAVAPADAQSAPSLKPAPAGKKKATQKKQKVAPKDKNGFVKVNHKKKAKGSTLSLRTMESVNKAEIDKQA